MNQSSININITLDEDKMPETIHWQAPDGGVENFQPAKAMLLGLWDGQEKAALRIDLWTNKMQMDEMNDFMFQSLMGMADTFARATRNETQAEELRDFAKKFITKAHETLSKEEKS